MLVRNVCVEVDFNQLPIEFFTKNQEISVQPPMFLFFNNFKPPVFLIMLLFFGYTKWFLNKTRKFFDKALVCFYFVLKFWKSLTSFFLNCSY